MRVEQLQEEFSIEVEWRPFELHPSASGGPSQGIDRGKDRSGQRDAYFERLRALGEEAGLTFQPPTLVPNSQRALEAAEFAREQGAFAPYHRALFDAYFGQGRDIGDVAVLAELGAANGLDATALKEALASRRYTSLVDERTEEARRQGVSGTPTVIFENGERRFPIVGAQEYAVFESVARRMGAESRNKNREPRATRP